jgi:hypothetical protein
MKSLSLSACLLIALAMPAFAGDESVTVALKSPSENIHCLLLANDPGDDTNSVVSCDIDMMDQASDMPARPASCQAEYGARFYVGAQGKAGLACYVGSLRATDSAILNYGDAWTGNGLQCISEKNGFTCTNKDGHGFFLSKGKQQIF